MPWTVEGVITHLGGNESPALSVQRILPDSRKQTVWPSVGDKDVQAWLMVGINGTRERNSWNQTSGNASRTEAASEATRRKGSIQDENCVTEATELKPESKGRTQKARNEDGAKLWRSASWETSYCYVFLPGNLSHLSVLPLLLHLGFFSLSPTCALYLKYLQNVLTWAHFLNSFLLVCFLLFLQDQYFQYKNTILSF